MRGEEEGRKNRPCAIVATRQVAGETVIVTVFPITHTAPENDEDGVELPPVLKKHLGLDDARSWVAVSEVNEFVWPGPDLRPVAGKTDRFDYGVVPPKFLRKLQEAFFARLQKRLLTVVRRT
jgi:hypothetical protein